MIKESRIPNNTKHNTSWSVGVWQDWAKGRNARVIELGVVDKLVITDILKVPEEELNYWLAKFVVEVRKKGEKAEFYPPTTLYQICCGLLRFLRNNGRAALNIFDDPMFKHFQDTLDGEMKRLTSLGVGANVRQAQAFSEEQEELLWKSNLLGSDSPVTLLNTMVFLIGKNFSLRSGKEHRSLKFSQLTLEAATGDEPEKLIYTSFGEKNNLGGLKHRAMKRKMCFTLVPSESVLILIKVCYATDILNILCLEFKLLNFCSFSVVHVKPSWPQYVGQYGETFV